MNVEKAKHIYEVSRQENIPEDIILAMEGLNKQEYEKALIEYLKTIEKAKITLGFEEDKSYQEFKEANFNEYFDPAKTYRYCKY